ncbi:DUF2177 family protein [Neoroseomonas soli]|uniref:DUF2177 family protein n=1 Tax=Neoroseomonas soli TaxID=1081025 RepID=A0A9X9WZ62_9PROT|nr:DUF2177 family protein [Neoroseomonas soli]MBR0672441.1 DUF2177 family protein [Neoroseomonas soli]
MPRLLRTYLLSGLVMLAIDAVWLTLTAEALYRPRIGHLMREDGFLLAPAIAFYLLYLLGILVLAQWPARCWQGALWRGAVFGLCAYGTYDLTNQATLRDWPVMVTLVDLAWGTMLTATVAAVGFAIGRMRGDG